MPGDPTYPPINNSTVHGCNPDVGSFLVFNENLADEATMESPVFSRGPNFKRIVSPELAQHLVQKLRAGETVEFPNRYELGEVKGRLGGSWKD